MRHTRGLGRTHDKLGSGTKVSSPPAHRAGTNDEAVAGAKQRHICEWLALVGEHEDVLEAARLNVCPERVVAVGGDDKRDRVNAPSLVVAAHQRHGRLEEGGPHSGWIRWAAHWPAAGELDPHQLGSLRLRLQTREGLVRRSPRRSREVEDGRDHRARMVEALVTHPVAIQSQKHLSALARPRRLPLQHASVQTNEAAHMAIGADADALFVPRGLLPDRVRARHRYAGHVDRCPLVSLAIAVAGVRLAKANLAFHPFQEGALRL
eukprot:7391487-Prymnesium_polylepis.2